jgi:hypothetical protein
MKKQNIKDVHNNNNNHIANNLIYTDVTEHVSNSLQHDNDLKDILFTIQYPLNKIPVARWSKGAKDERNENYEQSINAIMIFTNPY